MRDKWQQVTKLTGYPSFLWENTGERHLGNFQGFIMDAEFEQVEGRIHELKDQIEGIWTRAKH